MFKPSVDECSLKMIETNLIDLHGDTELEIIRATASEWVSALSRPNPVLLRCEECQLLGSQQCNCQWLGVLGRVSCYGNRSALFCSDVYLYTRGAHGDTDVTLHFLPVSRWNTGKSTLYEGKILTSNITSACF
ncbi:hypothetical protein J6590_098004 [Homalodisca vitripennis]|nr:hypothetical protein J6590_098004 [Homalodisca vitripennis]